MVELTNLEELLNLFPQFLDRTPTTDQGLGSVHYRVQEVRNKQYNDLRTSILLLSYVNSLNRPIHLWKTQNKAKEYTINCTVNIPHLKKITLYKVNPKTRDYTIINNYNFSSDDDLDNWSTSINETSTTNIPLYQYIVTVETWDEHFLIKGYPENDSPIINFIEDYHNDDGTITYKLITEDIENSWNINENDGENYFRFINTYTPIKEYTDTGCEIIVYSKTIEDTILGGTRDYEWELETTTSETITLNIEGEDQDFTSYRVEYNEDKIYCIIMIGSDDYFTIEYYPFPFLHDYEIFNHDTNLDVLGEKLNIPRWKHKQVNSADEYDYTEPKWFNRLTEDDHHYNERIKTYISNYGEKYLPELELWKQYGLPSILTNRKDIIASQCDTYMWTDCCEDNEDIVKNKTSITLLTNDTNIYYTVPKRFKVSVTCEDNESIYNVLDGFVEFRLRGVNYYARVKNGVATWQYTFNENINWGEDELQIQYTGFEDYDESNTITTNVNFDGKPVTITMDGTNYSATRGDYVILKSTVSYNDEIINEGIVEYTHNGELIGTSQVTNNKTEYRYTIPYGMSIGVNNIVATYKDTRDTPTYRTTNTTFKLNVLKERLDTHIESILFYPHGFSFRLHDSTHETIENQILYIYEEDKEIGRIKTYSQFYATYYDPNLNIDFNKKYYVEYKGSRSYNPSRARIYPVPKPVYKETHFVTLLVNNHFAFKLHDGRDNTLWDKNVTVRLNGTLIGNYTTGHDWIWISFNEHIDETDQIKLTYGGDEDYNPCTGTFSQIAPVSENMTSIRVIGEYHTEQDTPIDVYVQLLDKNNTPLTDYPLSFYHRDEILPDTFISKTFTDNDGIAVCTFTPHSNKNTYIRCVYEGNSWYDKSTNLIPIRVGAGEETRITGTLENNTFQCLDKITLRLTDINGEGLSNRKINLGEHHTITDTSTGEDIGNDTIFTTNTTDKDGYVTLPLNHPSGTFTLSATFNGDDEYKPTKHILGEVTLTKRSLCMTTYPGRDGTLHAGTSINTRVYDCQTNTGINNVQVYYYFKRLTSGAYQNLSPVTTSTNRLEQDGYAYKEINYSEGDYLVGVTIYDPQGLYKSKSTVYQTFTIDLNNNITDTTQYPNDPYLYPLHITHTGKIGTIISLSSETITSGEDMVATLTDETGTPLEGKTVYFRNADNLVFATVVTDRFGHARQTFNMTEVKDKIMYYGWESNDPLYESVENVAHVTINRRSLCFVENNINADMTVPVGFIYRNRLVDCRDYSEGIIDNTDYGRSMYGKVVSITFERFKKDTMESLGRTAPYYILINREDGRFEFPINLAPSGINGEYHYTFELNYDYDLNDKEYRNVDGYYKDKQTYPIKFYTEKVEEDNKKVNMSLSSSHSEISKGTSYEITCHLAPSTEAISECKTTNDIKGYVLFKTQAGTILNNDNPSVVKNGVASFSGTSNATSGQDFIITASFISTDYSMFNDTDSADSITIHTVEEGEYSNKNTVTSITSINPNKGATLDTFTVNVNVTTRGNPSEPVTDGVITLTGFDGNVVATGTVTDGEGVITSTVPNVLKGTYTDLVVEYKSSNYNSSKSTPNDFTVTASPISGDRYTPNWQIEIPDTINNNEAENYNYNVYLIGVPTPTGNVEVYLNDTLISTQTLNNGTFNDTIDLTGGSIQKLTFKYLGDEYYIPSNKTQIIGINTNTGGNVDLSLNGTNNITEGDNYNVIIIVTGDNTHGVPTGTIQLDKNNNTETYTLPLTQKTSNSATAVFNETSTGDNGIVKFRAYYNSDDEDKYLSNGYSDYYNVTVNTNTSPTKTDPSISLTGTSTISQGANYNLTVTVTGTSTVGYPTGSVELYKGGNKIDTGTLTRYNNSTSKFTFTPSSNRDTGTKSFKCKYTGDSNYNSTSYSNTVNVNVEEPTQLVLNNYTFKSGTTGTVEAILSTKSGVRLSGKIVSINIGGANYTMTSVGNGVYQKTVNMTGNRNGTMKASFTGETGVYGSCESKTSSLIIYQNRVGYGNLWVLYPNSLSTGEGLPFYIVNSNQDPLSGYPVSIRFTRGTDGSYAWSSSVNRNSEYTGLITSQTVSYSWSNVTLQYEVTFNSSTGTVSMGEGGSLSNLPNGEKVSFTVTYNP